MAQDLIVGVVDNYSWDKIKYWANSIERSGFKGHKALIVYNMDAETVRILTNKQFMLIGAGTFDEDKGFTYPHPSDRIMVDRFFHIYNFLKMLAQPEEVKRVIITDVRDVVFQDNPTKWLDEHFTGNHTLLLGSENLKYKDEPWGRNNMLKSFGQYFYDDMQENEIYCAGVIAGDYPAVKDFCLNLWFMCRGSQPRIEGGGGPDQAAMNIMLNIEPFMYMAMKTNPTDGWVVHAGTSMPAVEAGSGGIGEAYRQNPNMLLPFVHDIVYDTDNKFITVNGKKLTIVHQWDRVPVWKELIENKYGE